MKKTLFLLLIMLLSFGCSEKKEIISNNLLKIELSGDIAERHFEASGMAWYKDNLVILPQFPHKWARKYDGAMFFVSKERVESYINGENRNPIKGEKIEFVAEGLDAIGKTKGSGYEAITFVYDTVYVSIESVSGNESVSYLIKGTIDFEKKRIVLNANSKFEVKSQTQIHNMGEETIFSFKNNIYAIHEANGVNVNKAPYVTRLNRNLKNEEKIPFPNIEYRITDATHVDSTGKFYVTNYFYPGEFEKLKPNLSDEKINTAIEQILEFQILDDKIKRTEKNPIIISDHKNKDGSNWEGIVKFNSGFLLITDMFPETVLSYYK